MIKMELNTYNLYSCRLYNTIIAYYIEYSYVINKRNLGDKLMNIIKNLKQDLEAVSPIIGVILMVAITVVMAAIIGMFVFDVMPNEPAPVANIDIIVNDVQNFRVEHLGGDTIPVIYDRSAGTHNDWRAEDWVNMKVQINGVTACVNATNTSQADMCVVFRNEYNNINIPWNPINFGPGDILRFRTCGTNSEFRSGDIITVLHVPTGHLLAREVVAL